MPRASTGYRMRPGGSNAISGVIKKIGVQAKRNLGGMPKPGALFNAAKATGRQLLVGKKKKLIKGVMKGAAMGGVAKAAKALKPKSFSPKPQQLKKVLPGRIRITR